MVSSFPNKRELSTQMTNYSGISSNQLRQFIERIERLEEEKTELLKDIREVFAEAKSNGFDIKILRQVIKIRKMDQQELAEQEELLTLYMNALSSASQKSPSSESEAA
jgi:uncharacterized protein (UPF0335 family)